MWKRILRRPDRLNETVGRCGVERFRRYSITVANLEWAAIVVPFRDKAERYFLHPVDRVAQTQAYKGI